MDTLQTAEIFFSQFQRLGVRVRSWCQVVGLWQEPSSQLQIAVFLWPWFWERLKAGGEPDDRGWDGWMASLTQWTWVWVNSGSWWWTGRSGMLQSVGSQRVGHNWVTELNWTGLCPIMVEREWGGSVASSYEGACVLSRFSRVQLFATLWTIAHQTALSRGSSRQEN